MPPLGGHLVLVLPHDAEVDLAVGLLLQGGEALLESISGDQASSGELGGRSGEMGGDAHLQGGEALLVGVELRVPDVDDEHDARVRREVPHLVLEAVVE